MNRGIMNSELAQSAFGTAAEKAILREQIRHKWQHITPSDLFAQSEQIWSAVFELPGWQAATRVALYWSIGGEPDSRNAIVRAQQTKQVWLPCVVGGRIELRRYEGELRRGAFGIMEATGSPLLAGEEDTIDLIVVPGIAFDNRGYRLGRGGGFYDRLLPRLKALRVGVCLPCGMVDHLPHDEWDCRMDICLSAEHVTCVADRLRTS